MILFAISVTLDVVYYASSKDTHRAISYVGAVAACLCLVSFLALLRRWKPYRFVIQQSLETALTIMAVLILLLAMLYNALIPSSNLEGCPLDQSQADNAPSPPFSPPPPQLPGCSRDYLAAYERYDAERTARAGVLMLLEMLMALLVLLSIFGSLGYGAYDFIRTERIILDDRARNAALKYAADKIDEGVIKLLEKGELKLLRAQWFTQSANLDKLPVVTKAVVTLRVDGMHMSRVTGEQKADLVDEIARIAGVDPICILLQVRHEPKTKARLRAAIKQFEAIAQEDSHSGAVDLEQQLPETDEVRFQRRCDDFLRGKPTRVNVEESEVMEMPSPPPSPPPSHAPRGRFVGRSATVYPAPEPESTQEVSRSGDGASQAAAASCLQRAWDMAKATWHHLSGRSAADAAEAQRKEEEQKVVNEMRREVDDNRPDVAVASGEQLLALMRKSRVLLNRANKLEGLTTASSRPVSVTEHFASAKQALIERIERARKRLDEFQDNHLRGLSTLAVQEPFEMDLEELKEAIAAAVRCGVDDHSLQQYHYRLKSVEAAQTQRKHTIQKTSDAIKRLLMQRNPAKVDTLSLQERIEFAETLSMERTARPPLYGLWEDLRALVSEKAKPALAAAEEAIKTVEEIRQKLLDKLTFVRPKGESGCRVDLKLLRGEIDCARANGNLTDNVRDAERTYNEETQRCRQFMSALEELERAQKGLGCEIHLTLSLSDFLQAEITKESLESKLKDVKRRVNAELHKPRTLGELVDIREETPPTNAVRYLLPRCQCMPKDAFAEPEVASSSYKRQRRDVHVLSYGWRTPGQVSMSP